MAKSRPWRWLIAAAVIAAVLISVSRAPRPAAAVEAGADSSVAERQRDEQPAAATATHQSGKSAAALDAQDLAFLDELRTRLGPHIHIKHAQVRALEQLMAYLQSRYPDEWQARVQSFLAGLFPDLAAELYPRFQSLLGYHAWLRQERDALQRLPANERRAALWAERYRAFGPAADEIWAAERRNQQLGDALAALDPAADTATRLDAFVEAVHGVYGDRSADFLAQRRSELTERFLAADAVQSELRAMPADERIAALRQVRQALGMDEAALARWAALDRQRDARWSRGQQYMAARQALTQDGAAATDPQLDQLRRELFGPEAEIIAAEEQAGFFRYARERRYGQE